MDLAGEAIEPRGGYAAGRIVWAPQEGPQTWLLSCPIEDILFGGARGGGKSDALLGDWVAHASRSNGWARGVIFRRTTPQLEEITYRSKQLYPALGARWQAGTKTWVFPCGSRLKLRWLERDEDADNYQGHQYTWIGWDELGTWPSPDPIDKLRACLRSPHGIACVMRGTANPGGIGHQWLKERYISPAPPMKPFFDPIKRTWRVFIPSRVTDNRKLLANDPTYIDRLKASGPPWLVRAWLDGDWDASAGEAFFSELALLIDGKPANCPTVCDAVFAVVDTAVKTGRDRDGTAVCFFALNNFSPIPLMVLDWEAVQIEGALLETWLPTVFQRLEHLAKVCGARRGSQGTWIEDKASGMVLLQQAQRRGWPAQPIESQLTSVGKDERALSVSGYVYKGEVKITEEAFSKVTTYKDRTRNHFIGQVCGFKIGARDGQEDDLLDCFTYGIALALGNGEGF